MIFNYIPKKVLKVRFEFIYLFTRCSMPILYQSFFVSTYRNLKNSMLINLYYKNRTKNFVEQNFVEIINTKILASFHNQNSKLVTKTEYIRKNNRNKIVKKK